MKNFLKTTAIAASLFAATLAQAEVVEVASFNLKDGVTYEQFAPIDNKVETNHVSKQAGFLSRETAKGENGEWLVIVHWQDLASADASMNSFMTAPSAADFMANIDADSLKMQRYTVNAKAGD